MSEVFGGTRKIQEIPIGEQANSLILIDVPGVGETKERDEEYFQLYKDLIPKLDLVLWVVKADDRTNTVAQCAFEEIVKPQIYRCPVVFAINQVDKFNPIREWNEQSNEPGPNQQKAIEERIKHISEVFGVSSDIITPISTAENYGLTKLFGTMIDILPKHKKLAFVREAKKENVTEETAQEAEKGFWESIWEEAKNFASEVWETYGDEIIKGVKQVAVTVITSCLSGITSLFKKR